MTMTDGDEAGKLFVGGLSWETSKDNLQQYFSQYGEIVDSVVMKNPATGRSRGFGFVTFRDSNCVSLVLSSGPHELDGRTIDPKACMPRSDQQKARRDDSSPKLFLGGLPSDITEAELRNAFSEFGRVTDVVIMYDQETKKSRGFGFLSYDSEDGVEQACAQHFVTVNGKQVECKRAEPRYASRRGNRPENQYTGDGVAGQNRNWGAARGSMNISMLSSNGALSGGYQSWGSHVQQAPYTQQSMYASGYQNWNSTSTGYSTTPSVYGQSSYSGGYEAMGSYAQDSSSYGPSRGYTGASDGAQQYGSTQGQAPTYSSYGDQSSKVQAGGQQNYHPYKR